MNPFYGLSFWSDPYTLPDVGWTVLLFSMSFFVICAGIALLKGTGVF